MWFHNYISSDFFHSKKKNLVGIKDTTCSVVAFKSDKRIYFVCLSLANLFLQWDSLLRFVQFKDLWWPSRQRKFKSFNLFASFRWNLNKVSMKVSSQKKELLPYINFGRNNQLSDYRWLYMYVFLESLDLNVMEELMFTYFTIHAFCGVHQQETSSWLIDFEYKHQYWKICVHLIFRIVDWR